MDAEKYAGHVAKYLKCAGRKRREIRRQIAADIQAAAEEGSSPDQVIREMGEPKALAAEFNESFSEAERKAAGRAKLWRILAMILAVLAAVAVLVWWALPKMNYLSHSRVFSVEQVQERAELILGLFNEEDLSGMQPYLSEQMQEIMTEEGIEQIKLFIGPEWGAMNGIGNVYPTEISQMGKKYAVIQMTVSYEKVSATYTMTFDEELTLIGFYLK